MLIHLCVSQVYPVGAVSAGHLNFSVYFSPITILLVLEGKTNQGHSLTNKFNLHVFYYHIDQEILNFDIGLYLISLISDCVVN